MSEPELSRTLSTDGLRVYVRAFTDAVIHDPISRTGQYFRNVQRWNASIFLHSGDGRRAPAKITMNDRWSSNLAGDWAKALDHLDSLPDLPEGSTYERRFGENVAVEVTSGLYKVRLHAFSHTHQYHFQSFDRDAAARVLAVLQSVAQVGPELLAALDRLRQANT